MAKAGRKPSKDAKNDVVRLRISTSDKQAFERAAAADGLELSQWLRRLGQRAAGVLPPK